MTKQELERQVEKLNNRIRVLEQNNTELVTHNRIMKNVTQAMLASIHGKQLDIMEPQFNYSVLTDLTKSDITRSKKK